MNRRHFIKTSAAGLAASTLSEDALSAVIDGPKRVGLISTGWYGKADLFRLIQVAPVEVVSLCDVDKQLLKEAPTWFPLARSQQAAKNLRRLSRNACE